MNKLSKSQIISAKNLYMEYMSLRKIAAHVNCSVGAIQYYIKKEWADERDLIRLDNERDLQSAKKAQFNSIEETTIFILTKALKDLATRDRAPTMNEAKQASEIMNILDKITRLDKGEATDIVSNQEKALTVETIARKLSLDPFQPKEITFEDVAKNTK